MDTLLPWLTRFIHVSAAGLWLGGFAMLGFYVIPHFTSGLMAQMAMALTRGASLAGLITLLSGLVLVALTRGYGALFGGEWGGLIIISLVVAIVMMGLSDGLIRPSLRRAEADPSRLGVARRAALAGFGLALLAIAVMTRALYARS